MERLNPNIELAPVFIDHKNFHVYVETINPDDGEITYTEWKRVDNLVQESQYDSTDFELRLDENKNYTLKFGDNIHGQRLNYGDKIHVIYLQSNTSDGAIDAGEISVDTLNLDITGFKSSTELLNMCYKRL